MGEDITKEQLKKEIQDILKDADLDNTSAKKVRLQLQEKLDCDLTDRKKEVDELVMEVIDEQTQDDDDEEEEQQEEQEEESESEEERKPKKKVAAKPKPKAKAKKAASESGSEFSPEGSDDEEEEAAPSDGGGSDYEPDEPVKVGRGKPAKSKARRDSDGSSGEEWGGAKKKGGAKGRKKRSGDSSDEGDSDYEKPKAKKKKAGGGGGKNGYTAPVKLSEDLADIVGGDEMPRHEVVKRMWAYIKENKLQDPKNKQFIKCDEKLSKVIPTKKFRGFGMVKYLKDHMNVE